MRNSPTRCGCTEEELYIEDMHEKLLQQRQTYAMPAVYIPAVLELMPAVNIQKCALFLSVEAFNELMMAREKEVNTLIKIIGEKLVRLGKIQVEIMRIKMPECSTDIIGPLRTRWTCPIYLPGGLLLNTSQ